MATSFFLQFFFIILLLPKITKANFTHAQTLCLKHEKTLLLKVKDQLVFDASSSRTLGTWNQTDDCCSWEGVGCDSAGHVISLQLNDDGISGGFNDSSSLFSLNYLKELNLAANYLDGSHFPRGIVKLTHLTSLILSFCSLEGHVPEMIFQLPNLQNLDLYYNPLLTGTLPEFPQNNSFRSIVIAYTNFSGPLPNSIGYLRRLSVLDLSHSKFSGAIPFTLGNLTQLVRVDLTDNFFTGSIASNHFEGLSKVGGMDLSYNSLSGTIPISIFTLPSLEVLQLNHNKFSGQVSEFSNLSIFNLSFLDLSSNQLESPIPSTFFKLQSLRFLDLSNNLFNETFQLGKILNLPNLGGLDLSNNSLSLDATSIYSSSNSFHAKNSSLNTLDLSNNKIGGEIPSWIWELEKLTNLNLSSNMLVDLQKPYNVSAAASLLVLDLHSNQLRGELPLPPRQALHVDYSDNYFDRFNFLDIGSFSSYGLQFLSIANNSLSGPFPTAFICKCAYLQVLDLSVNNLSGGIPPCLFENVTYLQVLNLERNNISGRIPNNFSAGCGLKTLDLSHNHLVGDIPLSLENCTYLAVMNVGNNRINGNFPCMLPSSLQVLVLRSNRFHGEVRCQKQSLPNLQIIDISSNNFSGYLSPFNFSSWRGMMLNSDGKLERTELRVFAGSYEKFYYWDEVILTIKGLNLKLVKIWPEFTSIDFSNNNFQGDIPQVIGDLNALYLLNFSHNSLTGAIPKSFSNLTLLGALDISVNRLMGNIPKEIAGLTFLQVMNVSHNKLEGKIPIGSQIQTFSADSFEGNAGLCGFPLNISCTNKTSSALPPFVESDREIEWEYVFAAAGYAVGLGIFSWVLLFCRSFRDRYFEKIEDVFEKIFNRCRHKKRRNGGRRVARIQLTGQ